MFAFGEAPEHDRGVIALPGGPPEPTEPPAECRNERVVQCEADSCTLSGVGPVALRRR